MFLMIQNNKVCPVEGFILFGASTKRYHEGFIGEFGSGNKMGVNTLIRFGVTPVIFCGNLKLEFNSKKIDINNSSFERVYVKYSGKDESGCTKNYTEDLNHVVEYGAKDWNSVALGLREFVSNAIDSSELDMKNVSISIVQDNQVRAKSGTTRIFIPFNSKNGNFAIDVPVFFNDLNKWFLHFSEFNNLNNIILEKNNRSISNNSAVIYKKGVRVAEYHENIPSLYDYNIKDIPLNESRVVEKYSVISYATINFYYNSTKDQIKTFIKSFFTNTSFFEHEFNFLSYNISRNNVRDKDFLECFVEIFGEDAVIVKDSKFIDQLENKGYKPLVLNNVNFYYYLFSIGVKTIDSVLNHEEVSGINAECASEELLGFVEKIWDKFVDFGLTKGKSIPTVKQYSYIMSGGGLSLGYTKDEVIYINKNMVSPSPSLELIITIIEEISHYVTGYSDETRDFQDFILRITANFMMNSF